MCPAERELTSQLVDSSPDGILSFDAECRYTSWNPQMERISGLPASRVLGKAAFEVFPFLVETGEDRCFREALAGRESVSSDRRFSVPESGREGIFEGRYAPLRDADGRVVGGIGVIRDVTDRRKEEQDNLAFARASAARRLAFLANAGETLSSSLDYEETLRELAQLTLHDLADLCIVDVVEGQGLRRLATAHVIPEKRALADELRRRFSPAAHSPHPSARVLRSGKPELFPEITPEILAAHVEDPEHASLIRQLGVLSLLSVPLVARGATVGVISLGITESDRRYGPEDVEDVTDRVLAEERVRTSEERLRVALEGARMSVWDWDLTTGRVVCSENAREFWGRDIERAADILAIVHPDDHRLFSEIVEAPAAGEEDSYRTELRLVVPRGERWVQSRGRIERSGGKATRIIGVTVDITDLKAAEAATRLLADAGETVGASLDTDATLRELARLVVPRLADWCAVDVVTADGSVERLIVVHRDRERVEASAERRRRYPPVREAPRGPWHVIRTGEADWAARVDTELLRAFARDAEHLRILEEIGLLSYVCVPIAARGAPIGALTLAYAESGRHYQAADVAIVTDLARRAAVAVENARLYERLRDEDRRKDAFLATLAHELRNPLAPVRTGLGVLRVTPPGAASEKVRATMDRQIAHMARLIDDLLDVSRVTQDKITLQREPLAVRAVVESALEVSGPVLDAAGISVTVDVSGEPVVDGDRTRLAQVLSNVLNNAAKYTPRGGAVTVKVTSEDGDAVVRVRDTGIGIPREMLTRVFDMFVQVERSTHGEGGLGIGLTLARRLVELHGGRVTIESEGRGRGSEVVLRLPLAAGQLATGPIRPSQAPRRSAEARRVLIVEDNDDAAEMLALLLEVGGHETRRAGSAHEALAVLETFFPDLAFLDIGLPGKSGLELAREIRSIPRHAGMLLVAVTGWGQAEDRLRSQAAGFDHHLTKPVDVRQVEELVAGSARRAGP